MKQPVEKKGAKGMVGWILGGVAAVAAVTMLVLFLIGVLGGRSRALTVGADVSRGEISEFWYTLDASTDPPEYQRYRFYRELGVCWFYYETREGDHWPLTEADVTRSGTVDLTTEDWDELMDCLNGGTVRAREESTATGGGGPWLYLYWKGDQGKYQVFSFASPAEKAAFEALCLRLAGGEAP